MYYEGWITSIVWQLNRDQKAVEMIIQLFSFISDASKANSISKHGKGTTIWLQKGERGEDFFSRIYSDSKFDNKKYSDQADDNTEYSESRCLPYLILISIEKYSLIERLNKIDRFLHEKSSGSDKKPLTPPPPLFHVKCCTLIQEVINVLQLKVRITCLGELGKDIWVDKVKKYKKKQVVNRVLYHLLIYIVKPYDFMFSKKKNIIARLYFSSFASKIC